MARKTHAPPPPELAAVATPKGTLTPGDEFTVNGEGRFRVRRIRMNSEINAWPIKADGNARDTGGMRTFRPDSIYRIHKPRAVAR